MRNKKVEKINTVKVLQVESQKLKDKLETLKQQIKLKKQQKIMNKTSQSNGSFPQQKQLAQSKMNQTNYSQKDDKRLQIALAQLKIQNIEQKLKDKHIYHIEQLYALKDEEIDNWKDIPVGYRIKIKKYIQKNHAKTPLIINKVVDQQGQPNHLEQNNKNIEQIIKNRKNDQLFIPIDRHEEHVQEDQRQQLTQFQQQKMMLSILSFLGGKQRSSSIKSKSSQRSSQKKHVQWSKEVDYFESLKHQQKKYPKEVISKQIFHQNLVNNIESPIKKQKQSQKFDKMKIQMTNERQTQQYPNYKYCWSCLRKLTTFQSDQNKQFCSSICLFKYQQTVNPIDLLSKFQQTELQYNALLINKRQNQDQYVCFDIE